MAKLKYAPGETPIRGKREGFSFQNGHYYPVVNTRKKNDRYRSAKQFDKIKYLMHASCAWQSCTITVKNKWNAWATVMAVPSRKSPGILLNGYNLFCRRHVFYWLANGISAGTMTVASPHVPPLPTGDLEIGLTGSNLNASFSSFFRPYQWNLFLMCSPPVSVGKYVPIRRLRYMAWTIAETTNLNITAPYIANFGRLPVAGEVVFSLCQLAAINAAQVFLYHEFPGPTGPARSTIS